MLQTWGCGDRGGVTGGRCVQVRQAQAVAGGGLAGMRGLWGFEVGSGLCRLWLSKDAQGLVRSGSCGDERKRRDQWEAPGPGGGTRGGGKLWVQGALWRWTSSRKGNCARARVLPPLPLGHRTGDRGDKVWEMQPWGGGFFTK